MEHWSLFWPTAVATLLGVLVAASISALAYWSRARRKLAERQREVTRIEDTLAKSVSGNARAAGKWVSRSKAAEDEGVKVIPSPIDSYRTEIWDTIRHRYAELAIDSRRVSRFASFFELVAKAQEASQVERDVYVTSWAGDPRFVGQGVYRVAGHARLGTLGLAGTTLVSAAVLLLELGIEPPEVAEEEDAPEPLSPLITVEDLDSLGKSSYPTQGDKQVL